MNDSGAWGLTGRLAVAETHTSWVVSARNVVRHLAAFNGRTDGHPAIIANKGSVRGGLSLIRRILSRGTLGAGVQLPNTDHQGEAEKKTKYFRAGSHGDSCLPRTITGAERPEFEANIHPTYANWQFGAK